MEKEEEEVDIPTTLDAASHPNKYTKVSVLYLLLYRNWEREKIELMRPGLFRYDNNLQ